MKAIVRNAGFLIMHNRIYPLMQNDSTVAVEQLSHPLNCLASASHVRNAHIGDCRLQDSVAIAELHVKNLN